MSEALVSQINDQLPQTQCEECGYPGCEPYAKAIVAGEAINRCAPGGMVVFERLRTLTGKDDSSKDILSRYKSPAVAKIDAQVCIGCTKCIQACPTDAIVGSAKHNHFVLQSDCTGCQLCLPVCPVDCIDIVEDLLSQDKRLSLASDYQSRYEEKKLRNESKKRVLDSKSKQDISAEIMAARHRVRKKDE